MSKFIMPGHTLSGAGTGAVGHINEGQENRVMNDLIVKWMKLGGEDTHTNRLDKAKTSSYLAEQVALANAINHDLVVQVHFNAGSKDPDSNTTGVEVFYYDNSGKSYAKRICNNLSPLLRNRGSKQNQGLYWLKNTKAPAILIEVCFVDDKDDARVYNANKDKIAKLIAEGIIGKDINVPVTPPSNNTSTGWAVCVGAYKDKSNADRVLKEAKEKGFRDAYLIPRNM